MRLGLGCLPNAPDLPSALTSATNREREGAVRVRNSGSWLRVAGSAQRTLSRITFDHRAHLWTVSRRGTASARASSSTPSVLHAAIRHLQRISIRSSRLRRWYVPAATHLQPTRRRQLVSLHSGWMPVTYNIPPAGFRVATASASERALYGIPSEPSSTAPAQRRSWEQLFANTTLHFVEAPSQLHTIPLNERHVGEHVPYWSGHGRLRGRLHRRHWCLHRAAVVLLSMQLQLGRLLGWHGRMEQCQSRTRRDR